MRLVSRSVELMRVAGGIVVVCWSLDHDSDTSFEFAFDRIPCGVDEQGMPFGLQIVGPRGGDALVLAVAAELEALLAGDARTARPVPDLARLKAAPPISDMPGFLGFD